MIGLYDPSLYASPLNKFNAPNLDLMKLSVYYEQEEKKKTRLILPGEPVDSRYEKIFCFSDFVTDIPKEIRTARNVTYGGLAFSGGRHSTLEPKLAEFMMPNTLLYGEYVGQSGAEIKEIMAFLDAGYYRMALDDGTILPMPVVYPNKRFYIYDTSILIPQREQIFKQICKVKPSTIYCLHPIECHSPDEFFEIRNVPKFSRSNKFILSFPMGSNSVRTILNTYTNKFLAEISLSSNVGLRIGGNYYTTGEYFASVLRSLNTLYAFWAKGIPVKLSYKQTSVGFVNPMPNLAKALERWSHFNDTPLNRDLAITDILPKDPTNLTRKQYEKVLRLFPEFANLSQQSFTDVAKRGYWNYGH